MTKPRPFLTAPAVIDWLQWSDGFLEVPGEPDYPQLTLSLIAEYKSALTLAHTENARLRDVLKETDQLLEGLSSGREIGTDCNTAGEKAKRYARQIQAEIRAALKVKEEG